MKVFFIIAITIVLQSCSFDKLFLQPTELPQLPPNKEKVSITMNAKGDTTIVEFNTKTLQPTFLTTRHDTLSFDYTIESVLFTSTSKNKLNGWMLKPKNKKVSTTLLHFHGNAGFLLSQYQALVPLLEKGFQVFVFDYSGFGFSEGEASRDMVLLDGLSALTYVRSRDDVKGTKLVIYGQSLGGHLSAVVAALRQDEIDGLVIEGAFSSHKDIAAKRAGFFGRWFVREKYSALASLPNYKKPLLIIHSTEDKTIPFDLGQKLFQAGNAPKTFFEIKYAHIAGPEHYPTAIAEKIRKLLE